MKVLLPGEIVIDIFSKKNKIIKKIGGAPANVAIAISKFGIEANLVGVIGLDQYENTIRKTLEKNKVSTKYILTKKGNTTLANVLIDNYGERTFMFQRGVDKNLDIKDIPIKLIEESYILHLGSATAILGGNLWKTYQKLIEKFKNKIIVFDPNYREVLYKNMKMQFIQRCRKIIPFVDIIKISKEELNIITKSKKIIDGANTLLRLGAKIVLVTLGKEGTFVFSNEKQVIVTSIQVKQIDATGAGDAFIGLLIGAIAKNNIFKKELVIEKLLKYIKIANIGAALTVTKIGALESIPSLKKINIFYKEEKWK